MKDVPKAIETEWKIESTWLPAAIARVTNDMGIAEELEPGRPGDCARTLTRRRHPRKSGRVADDSGQTPRDRFAQGILDSIEIAGTPTFGHFGSLNVLLLSHCRQRTVSYWDCYYREAISPYLDYPGFRVLDAAIQAVEGTFLACAVQRTLQLSSRL